MPISGARLGRYARLTAGLVVVAALGLSAHPLKQRALAAQREWPEAEAYVWLPPPDVAPALAAGLGGRELWADISWMRALVYYGSGRVSQGEFRYLDKFIDNIIALDPKFHRVYEWAGYAVTYKESTATQEEFRTSVKYLEKGIEAFPDDGELYWQLGQRYWLDLKTDSPEERREFLEKGADYLETAMRKPNAKAVWATQAAEIRSKLGQREHAIRQLREVILTTDNKKAREKMLGKLAYLADSVDVANELERAADEFERRWKDTLPYAAATMFVLLGEPPSPTIEFDELATDRDLIGADSDALAPSAQAEDLAPSPEPPAIDAPAPAP